ncbi:PREDICTED: uncharacterized protein LOC106809910 isoform X2 [Priapulus caudatus]|uniref:Uncharacterized protein LOC106809910 isoform X2 n=1 Tax=Priapulus caudatus TaxID=37621 RepID=A0ABM1E8W5_PRICU|nr:PREDICTED: uncharacterized protein LOC106809910 isoform X2 [Priapulus caudatus]
MELALQSYTFAVEFDSSVPEYYVDRAALCHKMGKHTEAFKDLMSVPAEQRTPEVYKLAGKILTSLGSYTMAEQWYKEALKTMPNDEETLQLFQITRTKRLYQPINTSKWPVRVKFMEDTGKGIYTEKKIEPGEVLFRDTPVVSAQTIESARSSPACSLCSRSMLTKEFYFGKIWDTLTTTQRDIVAKHWPVVKAMTCAHCERECYCSEVCRDVAWRQHHQFLCPARNPAATELYDFCDRGRNIVEGMWNSVFSPMMLARVWASILSVVKFATMEEMLDEPSEESWQMARMPFQRFVASGTSGYAKTVPDMVALMARIFSAADDTLTLDVTEEEFETCYYKVACNAQSYSSTLYASLIHATFVGRVRDAPDDAAALAFALRDLEPPDDQVFGGLFQIQSCLNHSCAKNADVVDCQFTPNVAGVEVKALRWIEVGHEVTTVYVDTALPRRVRRAWLLRAYNFLCECERCRFEGDDGSRCCQCGARTIPPARSWKACGQCRQAWYCTPRCQKMHWKAGHKNVCVNTQQQEAPPQQEAPAWTAMASDVPTLNEDGDLAPSGGGGGEDLRESIASNIMGPPRALYEIRPPENDGVVITEINDDEKQEASPAAPPPGGDDGQEVAPTAAVAPPGDVAVEEMPSSAKADDTPEQDSVPAEASVVPDGSLATAVTTQPAAPAEKAEDATIPEATAAPEAAAGKPEEAAVPETAAAAAAPEKKAEGTAPEVTAVAAAEKPEATVPETVAATAAAAAAVEQPEATVPETVAAAAAAVEQPEATVPDTAAAAAAAPAAVEKPEATVPETAAAAAAAPAPAAVEDQEGATVSETAAAAAAAVEKPEEAPAPESSPPPPTPDEPAA